MLITRPVPKQPLPPHAQKVFSGKVFDVYQWEQKLYDGTTKIFEGLKRKDTVNVLAVTDDSKIILTEQEQPGMKPFLGGIGGVVDLGESPLEAAKRELLEESGYSAGEFVLWDAVQPSSKIDWAIFTFIAKGLKKVHITPLLDGGEKIRLLFLTFDEFVKLIADERYRDTEVALKILRAGRELDKVRNLFFSKQIL